MGYQERDYLLSRNKGIEQMNLTNLHYNPTLVAELINSHLGDNVVTAAEIENQISEYKTQKFWNATNTKSATFHSNPSYGVNGPRFLKLTLHRYSERTGQKLKPAFFHFE